MQLTRLVPPEVLATDGAAAAVLSAVIMRTNFVPGLRYQLGWRGLQVVRNEEPAWNAKIQGGRGIFGLVHEHSARQGNTAQASFSLHHFPFPDDDLVEDLPLQAALLTGREQYVEEIRRFIEHPGYRDLFRIATIEISVELNQSSISLTLDAQGRLRTIASDGAAFTGDGAERRFIIEPGGVDQDYPAFDVALPFFDVLVASAGAVTREEPAALCTRHSPATQWTYDRAGRVTALPSTGDHRTRLTLQFGDFHDASAPRDDGWAEVDLRWHCGEPPPAAFAACRWWNAGETRDLKTLDKAALGVREKPQLIIVTGFLGSGKTTFLQRFIEYQAQRSHFVAVIQNEIGAVGLDGKLLESQYAVKELDEGCVCCSLVGNLRRGITAILGDFQPDYVILETTGVANPLNLLGELTELEDQVSPGPTVTLVDCAAVIEAADEFALVEDQIRAADVTVLNKTDLVDAATVAAAHALVTRLNPLARVFKTTHGDVNLSELFAVDVSPDPFRSDAGEHHTTHAAADLSAVKVALPTVIDRERFVAALRGMPRGVFRAKGVVRFVHDESPTLVQYVAGRTALTPFRDASFDDRFLVLIGRDLDARTLGRSFESCSTCKTEQLA